MRIIAAAITLLALLGGCGQTGPLYSADDAPVASQQKADDDNAAADAP